MAFLGSLFGRRRARTLRDVVRGRVEVDAGERRILGAVFAASPPRRVGVSSDDEQPEALAGLQRLRRLRCRRCDHEDFTRLGPCPALRELTWGFGALEGLRGLAAAAPRLETLELEGAPVGDLSPLAGLGHLSRLSLRGHVLPGSRPLPLPRPSPSCSWKEGRS